MTSQAPSPRARPFQESVVPAILGPLGERLVETAGLSRGQRVLDVACGTGAVTRPAARAVGDSGSVVGSDLDAKMLVVAREASAEFANVTWRRADAVALPFADAVFDAVLCGQGLQFVPDSGRALREMRRVLSPGGLMAAALWQGYEGNPYFEVMHRVLRPRVAEETREVMKRAFAFADRDVLHGAVRAAGFEEVRVESVTATLAMPPLERFIAQHMSATPVAGELAKLGPRVTGEVVHAMRSALGVTRDDQPVELPFAIWVAKGRA